MTTKPKDLAVAAAMSPAQVLSAIVEKGVTSDNADAMIRLATFVREEESRRSFAAAFARFQSKCPKVCAETAIPDKLGNAKFRYEPLSSIVVKVGPILAEEGFGYSFGQLPAEGGRVTGTCTLSHADGYSKTEQATVRAGQGPSGATESQADSAAITVARRLAFCAVCGIVVHRVEADARVEGEVISATEAADLQQRVFDACSNGGRLDEEQVKRYLRFGGATTWGGIRRAKYEQLLQMPPLRRQGEAASPTPAAAVAPKPFPASFDDGPAWRAAMVEEMSGRWGIPAERSAGIFAEMEKKSGKSYLSMTAEARQSAWERLTTGRLDASFAPK